MIDRPSGASVECVARDNGVMVAALVLTGAPGTGKSSVVNALTTLLEIGGIAYGAIESEQLAWGSPRLGSAVWTGQLAAVIALQRQAGRRLFLIVATTETEAELRGVIDAVGAERALVVCLTAAPDLVAARIDAREPDAWPGKRALIAHARGLAATIPAIAGIDLLIDTEGRDTVSVAGEVRAALRAAGILDVSSSASG
jgi:hypothetical protein